LYGDSVRIRGILINLLNNSVKYTKEGKVILSLEVKKKEQDITDLDNQIVDLKSYLRHP